MMSKNVINILPKHISVTGSQLPTVASCFQTPLDQSKGLRERHTALHAAGRHLCIDSSESEATLKEAMSDVLAYAKSRVEELGGTMKYLTTMSLYDCQAAFHRSGGPPPNEANKGMSMRPDGGIIMATFGDHDYPILIGEDKVQGTNDQRKAEGKDRQALGNAIERAAKNIRGCEMLCAHMTAFPYVIFASGCDFHESETIAKRIEMMNMGVPNHYFGVSPTTTATTLDARLDEILSKVSVSKTLRYGIASVFVKAHKWDEMPHGSSRWRKKEIAAVCNMVIDQTLDAIMAQRQSGN